MLTSKIRERKKTLVALQPLKTVKIEQIVQLHGEKGEKSPFRKKDRKKACAKKWDPYNAHPLTRQM
ncbi:hypothetical protein ABLV76_07900 [Klebsiella sp. GB_Kp047]|uniref:hypothetical protein n=1 Tax=Klebsiella sp. GB_Kp047 TaxID=3153399 RepID=UPI0032B3C841